MHLVLDPPPTRPDTIVIFENILFAYLILGGLDAASIVLSGFPSLLVFAIWLLNSVVTASIGLMISRRRSNTARFAFTALYVVGIWISREQLFIAHFNLTMYINVVFLFAIFLLFLPSSNEWFTTIDAKGGHGRSLTTGR